MSTPPLEAQSRTVASASSKMAQRMRNLRANPLAMVLLCVGAVAVVYVLGSLIAQSLGFSDGVLLTELSTKGLSVATRLDPATTLRVGDEILAIEGRSIWEWGERTWHGATPPDWHVGQVLTYQVRRDGQVVDVLVTLRQFPLARLLLARFGVYALLVSGLALGGYLTVNRPDEIASHMCFVLATSALLKMGLHFHIQSLVTPWLLIGEHIIKFTGYVMLFSEFHHLFLIFPVPKLRLSPGSIYLRLLHIVNPAISVTLGLMFGTTQLQRFLVATQISTWIGLLMLAGGTASIVHTYVTARQPAVRGQVRWVAWGVLVGALPYLVFTGVPEMVTGYAVLTIEVTAFFLIAVPVTLVIAIARYRLFDIDVVVWQAVFYALYTTLLLGAYFVLRYGIGWLVTVLIGGSDEATVVFVAAFIAVSAFWWLREPALLYFERRLYRSHQRPQVLLRQAIESLTRAIQLEQLDTLLSETLPQKLGAAHGVLLVLDEAGTHLVSLQGVTFALPPREMVVEWAGRGIPTVLRSVLGPLLPAEVRSLLDEQDIELLAPLRVGKQVVGVWGMGPRVGRLSYTTADTRLVQNIARQAALAVENARLVRRMQADQDRLVADQDRLVADQDRLEAEVQRRTQAMRNDRNRLNAILQNMADALLVTDAKEYIQLTNSAFEQMVRRSSRLLLGQRLDDVVALPKLSATIQQALTAPGTVQQVTATLVNPRLSAGDDIVMGETILKIAVTALGDKSSVICVIRDVTREAEIDHIKSEFISTISHELRTPVTAILGFAKLTERAFQRSIFPLLPDEEKIQDVVKRVEKNLDIMVSEGETLTTLINDILDVSALDAGSITWHDQAYALELLVQDVVERLRDDAGAKGLALDVDIELGLPLLTVDPARIEQVLTNLVSNGIKFTQHGCVMITARRLDAGTVIHEWDVPVRGGVVVTVKDTGPGMREQELTNIFQRFYQSGDTLSGKPSGTGLGLAISREIVLHYGGEIWAESTLGVGSTFYFTLPLK